MSSIAEISIPVRVPGETLRKIKRMAGRQNRSNVGQLRHLVDRAYREEFGSDDLPEKNKVEVEDD